VSRKAPPPNINATPLSSGDVTTIHACCVAVEGRGLVILGASGRGKSALALELMGLGAKLVADDQTILTRSGDTVFARCPQHIKGMIEARGIGILHAEALDVAPVRLIVDLDVIETERLPPKRNRDLLGISIDLVFGATSRHFPFGILQYIRAGRID
jgi:HPr kinase/phosphorylase